MKTLIVDMSPQKNSLWKDEFVRPIENIIKKNTSCEIKHFTEEFDFERYDNIILSGSPLGDFESMNHLEKFEWLKKTNKPVIGICAGMQVIAKVFGCELIKCQEIGMSKIKTLKQNELFSGDFEAYSLHNFAVVVNDKFEVLAESENCVQAFKLKNREIYGVLFHPEVKNPDIAINFINI